jgi:hypothetical protein
MPSNKRILVKESGVMNFFKSFLSAKANGTESGWLQNVRKKDPRIADAFKQWDSDLTKSMQIQKRELEKAGIDTSKIDNLVKTLGLKNV